MVEELPRVLSIQSHVVSGYVGNKCANFALQLLGFEVDSINSVQLSNHTGYGKASGQILTEKDLVTLLEGLKVNKLDNYSHLLTGYVGSTSFLQRIVETIKSLKEKNPGLVYVCDPVMGDEGQMYVPKENLPIYRDAIIPLADIITPNQYEVELLTGIKLNSIEAAWAAIDELHEKGCSTVVVSSSNLGDINNLLGLASTKTDSGVLKALIEIPKIPTVFTGSGDLFACLFLAWMHKTDNLLQAFERTVGTLQAVLRRTYEHADMVGISKRSLELKLVQSKNDIEEPMVEVSARCVI